MIFTNKNIEDTVLLNCIARRRSVRVRFSLYFNNTTKSPADIVETIFEDFKNGNIGVDVEDNKIILTTTEDTGE